MSLLSSWGRARIRCSAPIFIGMFAGEIELFDSKRQYLSILRIGLIWISRIICRLDLTADRRGHQLCPDGKGLCSRRGHIDWFDV